MSAALLFLIGPRGSGKSTIARLVAEKLGWDWLDADDELEKRSGQSIRAIFAAEGEAGFRERESAILADLCRLRRHVIATGGGVILRPGNRALLRASGRVVWLTADVETLWRRIGDDNTTTERRPPLLPPPQGGGERGGRPRRDRRNHAHSRAVLSSMCRLHRRYGRTFAGRHRR